MGFGFPRLEMVRALGCGADFASQSVSGRIESKVLWSVNNEHRVSAHDGTTRVLGGRVVPSGRERRA